MTFLRNMCSIGGLFFALWRQLLSREIFLVVFGVIDILVLIGECLRIQFPAINKIFLFVLGRVMREHERAQFSGMFYYVFGVVLVTALFPPAFAVLGIMQLAVGDPAASLCGRAAAAMKPKDSKLRVRLLQGKSVAGTLGCAVACTAVNMALLTLATFPGPSPPSPWRLLAASGLSGLIVSLVELLIPSPQLVLPFRRFPLGLDDNAVLPLAGSAAAAVAFAALGLPAPTLRPFLFF